MRPTKTFSDTSFVVLVFCITILVGRHILDDQPEFRSSGGQFFLGSNGAFQFATN